MKKRIRSFILVLCMMTMLLGATAGSASGSEHFTDIPADAWYAEYIDVCYQAGLMNGVGGNRFDPNGTVSIAQAISVSVRLNRLLTGAEEPPTLQGEKDAHWVESDAEYLSQIWDEVSKGKLEIFTQMADTVYEEYPQLKDLLFTGGSHYDENCPRVALAILLYASLPVETFPAFNNYTTLPELDTEGLRTLYNAGLLSGVDDAGTFDGAATLTRAQLAAIVARVSMPQMRLGYTAGASDDFDFDFDLFAAMPQDENYMISPISLKLALAMAANGAEGNTRQELLETMGIADLEAFNQEVKAMIEAMNNNALVEFNVANSIWFNTDYYDKGVADEAGFSDEFAAIIQEAYHGVAEEMTNDNGKDAVNGWIAQETRNKIRDVINDTSVKESLAMLVNAIYFKGDWASPFKAESTADRRFTDRNGSEHTLSFMNQTAGYPYYQGNDFRMVAKAYEDTDIKMYLILPEEGAALTQGDFDAAVAGMRDQRVHLSLPKFKVEYTNNQLVSTMQAMGVRDAFDENTASFEAMLQGIPTGERLFISKITQKTFIEVDEKGTEAAAATVIEMTTTTSIVTPEHPIEFICDRPFIYIIRDDSTGTILFMGEYAFVD